MWGTPRFASYAPDELVEIAVCYGEPRATVIEAAAREALNMACKTLRAYLAPDSTHGIGVMQNGRFARNVVERAERLRDSRVAAQHRTDKGSVTVDDLETLRTQDVTAAVAEACAEKQARTLPLKQGQGDSMSNAAYDPAGALHLEDNPIQAAQAFTATGVDVVSISQTTVYRAGDPDGARRLAQSLGDATAQRPASQPAAVVPGLPGSRCVRIDGEGGLVPRYSCIAAADRFAFKAVARQLDNARQQIAAQYLILTR
ncbi:MAG: DUF7373 family lipoprotein [Mycobacterium sp.]